MNYGALFMSILNDCMVSSVLRYAFILLFCIAFLLYGMMLLSLADILSELILYSHINKYTSYHPAGVLEICFFNAYKKTAVSAG